MKIGILGKASSAKIETEKARVEEVVKLAVNEAVLNEMGQINNITADDILRIVQKNENKTNGISYTARTDEGAVEPRDLPLYIVFDKSITSIKQTIKVPVDLNLNVGTAIIDGEEQETNYEEMAKEEIEEIIKNIGDDVTPDDIVSEMKKNHSGANISSTQNTFPSYIVIPSKTYGEDQLEELQIAVSEDKKVGEELYARTPKDYIPIYTKAQLKKIGSGENVTIEQENNKPYKYTSDGTYILMNNISLADEEWTPITELATTLEGNNKTISGMKMTITQSGNYGLFNQLSSGSIQNLNIKNINITISDTAPTSLTANIGGVFGKLVSGQVSNCKTYGNINCSNATYIGGIVGTIEDGANGSINKCTNNINISTDSTSANVGGIIGNLSSNVSCISSTNKGNITTKSSAGGIVGYSNTSKSPVVQNCLNIGNIIGPECNGIGGIIGKAYCPIVLASNTNIGNVVGKEQVGGIVGYLSTTSTTPCNIVSNVNKGNIQADRYYGGILGYGYDGNISLNACTNSGKITNLTKSQHSAAIGGIIGEVQNSNLQCNQNTNKGTITIEAPGHAIGGIIGEATNLKSGSGVNANTNQESAIISINANSSLNSNSYMIGGCIGKIQNSNGVNANKNFADINVSVKGGNSPTAYSIGGIVGEAEQPDSFTSSQNTGDITIAADKSYDVGGIVGKGDKLSVLASNENISNINFENCQISNVGGIAGNLNMISSTSTVTQLKSNGIIKLTTSVTSTSSQPSAVGGIIGYMQSSNAISKCEHIGKIDLPSGVNIGGIIGSDNNNNIENSCHVGDIVVGGSSSVNIGGIFGSIGSSSAISNSYVKGNITGGDEGYIGTMAGYCGSSPTITNSYYCCKINDKDTDKIIGNLSLDGSSYKLSEENSQKQESYVGFDFSSTWKLDETKKIPVLK